MGGLNGAGAPLPASMAHGCVGVREGGELVDIDGLKPGETGRWLLVDVGRPKGVEDLEDAGGWKCRNRPAYHGFALQACPRGPIWSGPPASHQERRAG